MSDLILVSDKKKSFFIINKAVVKNKMEEWKNQFGDITPLIDFGASSQPELLDEMKNCGCSFYYNEIIYYKQVGSFIKKEGLEVADFSSNTCESYIESLKGTTVNRVVVNSIEDIEAYVSFNSSLENILRISVTDTILDAGCLETDTVDLFVRALSMGVLIESLCVSCSEATEVDLALDKLDSVFAIALNCGINIKSIYLLGEGVQKLWKADSKTATATLLRLRNLSTRISVFADASRFFVCEAYTIYSHIIGKKVKTSGDYKRVMYYTDNGVYCSFYNAYINGDIIIPCPISIHHSSDETMNTMFTTTLFGPTCDSLDCLGNDFMLPELEIGDWLKFEKNGYQCSCYSTRFNGFEDPDVFLV